ncbi:GntR family transcriptional regulator [Kaustia mangrovi]|uniref:GntR family transcriptional regulator n=1 Tax=Kaustia mangrovi TaxID=2593653 RepID=A0A7S8C671_9HYPH|nr:GntR family transcriptional regulator [Kaustia mangrovi]QPC44138.1 GntR family transcriptional regulator [Kaustia mangrovi]
MSRRTATQKRKQPSVYERIRNDVIAFVLRPEQELDESSLAERYAVSRTPIREALIRLTNDRLVEALPGRGIRVSPFIVSNYPRYMEATDLIRRALARGAAHRRTTVDLAKLKETQAAFVEAIEPLTTRFPVAEVELSNSEWAFHTALAESSHNHYLIEAYSALILQGIRMMRIQYGYQPIGAISITDYLTELTERHARLVAAIEDRDLDGAEEAARAMHKGLADRLSVYFQENLTEGISLSSADG